MDTNCVLKIAFTGYMNGHTQRNDYWGSIREADDYFRGRMFTEPWDGSELINKVKALTHATRLVKALPFDSCYTAPSSIEHVRWGVFETAFALLSGVDPEQESQMLPLTEQIVAGARTMYDRSFVPEWIRAGIPSSTAWRYLRPYLVDEESFTFSRV